MKPSDKAEVIELFNAAVLPFHGVLDDSKKAIVNHAIEAAINNRMMFEQLKSIDEKMDKQTMQIGVVSGRMESLTRQTADHYKQLGVLNQGRKADEARPGILAKSAPAPNLMAGFMNNSTVQVILAIIALGACYGLFSMAGVDITKAKELVTPTSVEASSG
jgi:hypothetical protein